MYDVLIIGCGSVGRRAARRWLAAGRSVAALTRNRSDEIAILGITPISGNVLDPITLRHLPEARTVLYAVGLDRTAGHAMRVVYVEGLKNVLAVSSSERFLYVSSTSVYGQTDGAWVDETSPTTPVEDSGQVVLEAEQVLATLKPEAVILRFAGIYGPGRILRKNAILTGEPLFGDAEKYLNLIHVDDGVTAILATEARGTPGEIYNIADDSPPTRRQFYTRTAELLQAPPARFEAGGTPTRETNRRISNRKAREQLEFNPAWPAFSAGLAAALADPDS